MTCSRLAGRVTDQFGNVELADDTAFVVVGGRVVVVPEIPPLGSHQLKKTVVTGLFVAEFIRKGIAADFLLGVNVFEEKNTYGHQFSL